VLVSLLLLAGGLWFIGSFAAGRGLPAMALPAAGLLLLGLIQLAAGRSAAPVWTAECLLQLAGMLAVLIVWSERAQERRAADRLAVAVLAVCTAEALFGAAQSASGIGAIYGQRSSFISIPFGSFVNHNHFAGLMEMGVLVAAGWAAGMVAAGGDSRAAGLIGIAVALVLAAAHLASRSRAGLASLAVGAAALASLASAYVPGKARVRAAAAAAAGMAVLAVFALLVIPSAARERLATLRHGTADPSGSYRIDVARDTVRLARDRLSYGWGLGAFADAFPAYKSGHGHVRTVHAENDALELLAEAGAVGVLLVVAIAVVAVRGLRDRLTLSHDRPRNGLALGAAAGCAALVAHSAADFNLRIPANALVFASLVGLTGAPRRPMPALPRPTAALAGILFCLLAIAAAWRAAGAREWEAVRTTTNPDRKLAALERLLRRHPYLAEAHRAEGLGWRDVAAGGATPLAVSRLARAEGATLRALRLRPRWGEAWGDLAWTRYSRGDATGAREALERSRGFDPTNLPLGLSRAELVAQIDGPAAAVAELAALRRGNAYLSAETAVGIAQRWTSNGRLLDALRIPP
jgi:O-antigen ligase